MSSAGARAVSEFGPFTPDRNDATTIAANTATINRAIAEVGRAGGGTICLPPGTYHLAPADLRTFPVAAVIVNADNITLWGAGMDGSRGGTRLRTRSEYSVINGSVVRGAGLWILGTQGGSPRRNITLRDFELDGGAGFTGNFGWPADPTTGDGWDITHKGIVLAADDNVDQVTLERVWVHSYRGEVIYAGGMGLGRVTVRGIRSEDTNASTFNMTGVLSVEDSYFGKSRFWIEIGTHFAGKSGVFRNNTFKDAARDGAIALAQGDGSVQPYTFENNRFENCGGATFYFGGGVGGPVQIRNNTFVGCGGIFTGYAPNPLPGGRPENQNITFENNTLEGGGYLAYFFGTDRNIVVRGNTFRNPQPNKAAATAVFYCCGNYQGVVVENNTFINMRGPEQTAAFGGERPLFRNNRYQDIEIRDGQGGAALYGNNGYLRPLFEQSWVASLVGNVSGLNIETTAYPDGQETTISVEAGTISLPAVSASYELSGPRVLTTGSTLKLRFSKAKGKWIEAP
ncbi:MAG: right-handed parallel beta-helix repeat-containing protein [Anaerolineae bacterium]|nr:right-handed parallel beta-helix repeat-containing protein [Candidatus Roseilinea sp.]MDW8451240.1 right-handed parallel beta-helix repeat-containing protein [Anaerolineae bacterium]